MTVAEAMVKYQGKVNFPKQVEAAQKCLLPDETVLYADSCRAYEPDSTTKIETGIFVVTQKRVFFSCISTLYQRVSEIPLKGITGMQRGRKSFLDYTLRIEGLTESIILISPNTYIQRYQIAVQRAIDICAEEEAAEQRQKEAEATAAATAAAMAAAVKAPPAAPAAESMGEQLRTLKGLLDDGIITQEEFEAKKKQILGL